MQFKHKTIIIDNKESSNDAVEKIITTGNQQFRICFISDLLKNHLRGA